MQRYTYFQTKHTNAHITLIPTIIHKLLFTQIKNNRYLHTSELQPSEDPLHASLPHLLALASGMASVCEVSVWLPLEPPESAAASVLLARAAPRTGLYRVCRRQRRHCH